MGKFHRTEIWAGLGLIVLLAGLSVVGAFYGSDRAAQFFSSLPLTIYWLVFTGLLLASLATFRHLVRAPALLLIHLGCVFVLIGAMWGSSVGHRVQKKLVKVDKVPFGYMKIYEGAVENRIISEDERVLTELPFRMYLKDFRIDYYRGEPYLRIDVLGGEKWGMPARVGQQLTLEKHKRKIKIIRVFENFKIMIEGGERIVTDVPDLGRNPAVEIEITEPNGIKQVRYIFENFPQESVATGGLKFTYRSQPTKNIRDYFSDLIVFKAGKQVTRKMLEVNHPLHYGGYHFYQHSYDSQKGQYTVLTVVSDSGLSLVYSGYLMLSLGVLWHFWFRHVTAHLKRWINGN